MAVTLLPQTEARIRKLAEVTRLPIRAVQARLAGKVDEVLGALAVELGAEAASRHEAALAEISGTGVAGAPVVELPHADDADPEGGKPW